MFSRVFETIYFGDFFPKGAPGDGGKADGAKGEAPGNKEKKRIGNDLNQLCAIAISRFGYSFNEFYLLTPKEFDLALKDHKEIHFTPMKRMCEMLRIVVQFIHNSVPGRKHADMIRDPKRVMRFEWENPEIQSIEQMRSFILGLSHMKGVKVLQNDKQVNNKGGS